MSDTNIVDNSAGKELNKIIEDQLKKSVEAKFAIWIFLLKWIFIIKRPFS